MRPCSLRIQLPTHGRNCWMATIFLGPAKSIEELLETAPYLRGGQIVTLNPERTLGALGFR